MDKAPLDANGNTLIPCATCGEVTALIATGTCDPCWEKAHPKPPADKPHRAFELEITIGGDTWADVLRDVRDLASHIPEHGPACNSVSGGPGGNHIVTVRVDETMTHDRYFKELDAYLEETKKAENLVPLDRSAEPDIDNADVGMVTE